MILQPVISPARRNTLFSILSTELQKFRFKKFSKNAIVSGDLGNFAYKDCGEYSSKDCGDDNTTSLRERTSIIVQPVTRAASRTTLLYEAKNCRNVFRTKCSKNGIISSGLGHGGYLDYC